MAGDANASIVATIQDIKRTQRKKRRNFTKKKKPRFPLSSTFQPTQPTPQ
jgi:hypothetical protein